ncbi:MAG: hypothetical protein RQ985_01995 [Dehalococcoidia bacterium]|nr:hypothetical protein [Dehalococcoidia bacterium]
MDRRRTLRPRIPPSARPPKGKPPSPIPSKRRLELAWQRLVRAGAEVAAVFWDE